MDIPRHASPPDPVDQRRADRARLLRAVLISAGFVAVLGWVALAEQLLGDFAALRLRPGEAAGLIGVLTAPLLHGSLGHLVANSLPLLILGSLCLAVYPRASLRAVPVIWLLSGLGVWLFGRPAPHLGASGLTHGLMFFVFLLGLLRRDRAALAAAMIAFFLYGGMLMTIFPRQPGISWEYHLFGALAGAGCAIWLRRLDPPLPRRRYSWEDEVEEEPETAGADPLKPPRPDHVPPLWPGPASGQRGRILRFPRSGDEHDREP